MEKFLLDTNICRFLLRGKYHIDEKTDAVGLENCFISEITVAELKYGEELGRKKGSNYRAQPLNDFLSHIQILPISQTFDFFASEKARLRMNGTPADDNFDLLIGCTSVVYGLALITENLKDFKHIRGIRLANWIERAQ